MGWLFKKKRDVIDLTEHQRRTISKQARKTSDEVSGYKDLSESPDIFSAISSSSEGKGGNSFRTNEAGISNKLEDIEFKLDNLRKKVDDILNRLEVVERKAGVYTR